jgi:predicted phage-related endonuclease
MGLIDADVLMTDVRNTITEKSRAFDWINLINRQPTAYDVDKVVEQLKRDKFIESETTLSDVHQGYNAGLSRAIEIVKDGGVNG